MKLQDLCRDICPLDDGAGDTCVSGITADSRAVKPGMVFAALPGSKLDGSAFVPQALANGAAAILVSDAAVIALSPGVPVLRSTEPRRALAQLASRFFGPGPEVIVAVTGTSGKTSVAEFTRQIFTHLGHKAASLGTLGVIKPGSAAYGTLTTPDPVTLARTLAELRAEGVTHLAMEASSHGLDQFRLDGVKLTAAAFNNLGRDHLDYHPTVAMYLNAKLRLFRDLMQPGQPVIVNKPIVEDGHTDLVLQAARDRGLLVRTSGHQPETFQLKHVHRKEYGIDLTIVHQNVTYQVHLSLVGAYQAENALVAAALAIECGETPVAAFNAIEHIVGVKGRLETVGRFNGGCALVDYAHKPEALAAALTEIRNFMFSRNKLICVFGCGGDRDKGKRPIMGSIARQLADIVIVTDDNPRSEDPEKIRAEILLETPEAKTEATKAIQAYLSSPLAVLTTASVIADRAEAIRTAVAMMGPGDVVLVAGKGHETGQIVGTQVLPFSDQDELRNALKARGGP